jgi:hypothetical protein
VPAIGSRPPSARQVPLPLPGLIRRAGVMSANRILVADVHGTLRRVPCSATASMLNSPHGGSGAVPCTACDVLMKAITNGPPQWFERLASWAWIRQITRHDHVDFATSARQLSRSVDLCDRSLRLAGPRRVDPTGRPASPAPIVSAPSTIAATGATRSDHTFAPTADVVPSRPSGPE